MCTLLYLQLLYICIGWEILPSIGQWYTAIVYCRMFFLFEISSYILMCEHFSVSSFFCRKGTQDSWGAPQGGVRGDVGQRAAVPKEGVIRIPEAIELRPQVSSSDRLNA